MKLHIEETIEIMCPQRCMKGKVYDDPWITREIIEMIKDKDRLIQEAKRTGREEDWEIAKRARNYVSSQVRNLKADFLIEEQENNIDDPKKYWRSISSIIPKGKGGKQQIVMESEGYRWIPASQQEFLTISLPK